MKLLELFNNPTTWNWTKRENVDEAHFKISEFDYSVFFPPNTIVMPGDEQVPTINIIFKLMTKGHDQTGITNTGNSIPVFATVTSIIKEYIQKHSPPSLFLQAKEPTRVRLYKRLTKSIPGYYTESWVEDNGRTSF